METTKAAISIRRAPAYAQRSPWGAADGRVVGGVAARGRSGRAVRAPSRNLTGAHGAEAVADIRGPAGAGFPEGTGGAGDAAGAAGDVTGVVPPRAATLVAALPRV